MPKFSIIIPAYNVAPYLRECLDSVLAQDFENWECVVVDDESTDEGPRILDEYAAKDNRIRVIHQKNKGEGGARNSGIAAAKGEWIFFLDGDDVMAPNALMRLAALIEKYPDEGLIRFGFKNFEDGESLPKVEHSGADGGSVDISHEIAYDDFFVYVWQFLYRRSLIEGMKFDRYKRGADRTFIVPVLCKAKSFVATDDVGYLYRKRTGSAMNSRPSVQVLKDELSHRVDVIAAIDASGKKMAYRKTKWLELYCTRGYQRLVDGYSVDERRVLMSWFYHELPRIRSAKDFSCRAKFDCLLYVFCRGRFGWRFVSERLPNVQYRVKTMLTALSRVIRAIKRRFGR